MFKKKKNLYNDMFVFFLYFSPFKNVILMVDSLISSEISYTKKPF